MRLSWNWLPKESATAVEVAELFADGLIADVERTSAEAELWWVRQGKHNGIMHWRARLTLAGEVDMWAAACSLVSADPKVKSKQTAILRDIFGDPFLCSLLSLSCLDGMTPQFAKFPRPFTTTAPSTACRSWQTRFQDAGCADENILAHCRGEGPHVRGCWVVDLLLKKS